MTTTKHTHLECYSNAPRRDSTIMFHHSRTLPAVREWEHPGRFGKTYMALYAAVRLDTGAYGFVRTANFEPSDEGNSSVDVEELWFDTMPEEYA